MENEEESKLLPIVYYNIIIELRKILKNRYQLLEKCEFNISKIERKFIKEKIFINSIIKKYKKAEEKENKGESSQIWLFNGNEKNPKPFKEMIINDEYKKDLKEYKGKNIDLNLDILKIKDLSKAESLDDIVSILKNAYSISQAFMFCIGKLKNKQINEIFNYLYEIFLTTKNSNKSILSLEIKYFINSFINLCSSLKGSDIDLKKFTELPKIEKGGELALNEEKPSPNVLSFQTGIFWKSSKAFSIEYKRKNVENNIIEVTIEKESAPRPVINNNTAEIIEKKKKINPDINKNKIEFERVRGTGYNILEEGLDNEEDKKEIINLKRNEDIIVELKDEEKNKLKTISDEGVTNAIIKRMLNNISIDLNLKLPDSFPEFKSEIFGDRNKILEKSELREEGDDFITKPFHEIINEFSKNVYIKFFQQCYNFDKKEVCGVIGIDICRTIDKKYKLFHTVVATSMAHCFNSIEIPYSIVVFCDYGVQFIIKDFEEPHQEDISQLIFDAIMTPRCSTRIIADACYFISQKVNCKDRPNKKIFIISNGLDTKLKIGEKWNSIFSNEKEKFCFYFIKPKLDDIEMNEIIKIWDDFKEKTKTEMAKISEEDILNLRSSMYLPFRNTMQSKIFKAEKILKEHKISQPEFKDIMYFTKDYQKILNSIADDMINSEDYFVQNKVHIPSKGKFKIEDFVVKNPFKINKIESLDPENNL